MCKNDIVKALPRITLGLLFLVGGLTKLLILTPQGFASGMITPFFGAIGLVGTGALVASWLVTVGEILGGLALLMGKLIPRQFYMWLIRILILITIAAVVFVDFSKIAEAGGLFSKKAVASTVGMFKNIAIVGALVMVCHSKAIFPFGLTGDKVKK